MGFHVSLGECTSRIGVLLRGLPAAALSTDRGPSCTRADFGLGFGYGPNGLWLGS